MGKEAVSNKSQDYVKRLRAYFFAGLLVMMPIYVTFWLIHWIYSGIIGPLNRWIKDYTLIDEYFRKAFEAVAPQWLVLRVNYDGYIPGLGLLTALLIILAIGMVARNYVGRRYIRMVEDFLARVPFIKPIYKGAKQVSTVFLERKKDLFQAVVLIEYPRKGIWSMGFLTQTDSGEISAKLSQEMACVFISTTPNPTSGLFVILPKKDLVVLDMSIEDALKMVISGGLVTPSRPAVVMYDESEPAASTGTTDL